MAEKPDDRGRLRRLWHWFWTPTSVLSVGFTLIAGFIAGILFWGGFHWAMESTNTEEFCVSCHTMETNLGEYRETVHYNNHSGVRAICSDCHVPHEWNYKVKAKIIAVKDVYHEILGTISTPEWADGSNRRAGSPWFLIASRTEVVETPRASAVSATVSASR